MLLAGTGRGAGCGHVWEFCSGIGEPVSQTKWIRAQMALENGTVVELPLSLWLFSRLIILPKGAVEILSRLGIDPTFGTGSLDYQAIARLFIRRKEAEMSFLAIFRKIYLSKRPKCGKALLEWVQGIL